MKPSRPRIFIVSKKAKPTQLLKTEAAAEGQQVRKERGNSKRKSMFVQMVGREPQERRERYEYNLKNHIHTESLGTILSCDLLGNAYTENHTQNKQRDEEKEPKGILHAQTHIKNEVIPTKEDKVEQKIEGTIHEVNNQQTHENLNNRTFSSHRLKIFDQNFKPNAYLSSVSIKRKHIFFRHQSQQNRPLLNTSLSKQRKRIFSHDNIKPFLHLIQQNPPQKPLPLQATIKQQDEQSRITQPIREQLHRSGFPQL